MRNSLQKTLDSLTACEEEKIKCVADLQERREVGDFFAFVASGYTELIVCFVPNRTFFSTKKNFKGKWKS